MHILVLAPQPFFQQRGTPIAVRLLVETLARLGHRIDLLVYHEGQDVAISGVTLHRVPRPWFVRHVPIGPSWQKLVCDVRMWFCVRRLLRAQKFDVIHAVEESAFLAARCGRPFVFDMDSHMSGQLMEKSALLWPVAKVFNWLERHALRRCSGALAICEAIAVQARRHQRNVHLLPDAAFAGDADLPLPPLITAASGLRFMYVGNLQVYQGVDLMLGAFARFAPQHPDAVLVIVGGDPPTIEAYGRQVAALGIADRVKFAGPAPIEALGRVLQHADILVSPRIHGVNTPMKLYSYLLSGRPVLATRLPTHTQVVGDEEAMLVAPTVDAMADGMHRLASAPDGRARIGAAGRKLAMEQYSTEAYERRLQNFYQNLELLS